MMRNGPVPVFVAENDPFEPSKLLTTAYEDFGELDFAESHAAILSDRKPSKKPLASRQEWFGV